MSMPITPGFGAIVATEIIGGVHHQRVLKHNDDVMVRVVPPVSNNTYQSGQILGNGSSFEGAARTAGGVMHLQQLTVVFKNVQNLAQSGALDVLFFSEPFAATPANGASLALTDDDLAKVLAVIRIEDTDFIDIGGHKIARWNGDVILRAAAGATSVMAVVIARSTLRPAAADGLSLSASFQRN